MRLPAIFGNVLIEVIGGYPERWLNLAAENGIVLWEIRHQGASLFCRAVSADYRRLRPLARRAGVRMRIREKHGIFHRFRHRRLRAGVICGTFLFLLLLQLLSSRIWIIRIVGNDTVSEDKIREVLASDGIREGSSFAAVDLTSLRLTSLQKLPELTWLGVHQSGSILTVEVTERASEPPTEDTSPANIIAACDGIVLRIDTLRGQAVVNAGDAVRKGDLLISGITESKVGPTLKRAEGTVLAHTSHTLTVTVPLRESITVPDREIRRPALSVFGLTVPLYTNTTCPEGYRTVIERHPLMVGDIPLPLGITETRLCYDKVTTIQRSVEEATTEAEKRLSEEEAMLSSLLSITDRSLTVHSTDHAVTITAVYVGTREIGTVAPIG